MKNDKNIHNPSYGGFTSQAQLFPFQPAMASLGPDIVGQQGRVLRQHMDQAAEAHLALVNPGRFSWKMICDIYIYKYIYILFYGRGMSKWLRYPLVNIPKALENHYFIAG